MKRHLFFCSTLLIASLTTACSTLPSAAPTSFKPASGKFGYGYSESKLDAQTYRVVFKATDTTPADVVQQYTLRRAAEIARGYGQPYISIVRSDVTTYPIKARKRMYDSLQTDFPQSSQCTMSGCNDAALNPPLQNPAPAVETQTVNNVYYQIEMKMWPSQQATTAKTLSVASILNAVDK